MFPASKQTIAIPTGETVREQLKDRGMTQKEFAVRMGMSEKHISHLLNGRVELTSNAALRLESVLGIPASYWLNLEAIYREKLARVEEEAGLEEDAVLVSKFPYNEMAKLGWIPSTRRKMDRVRNLRSFFGVARLSSLEELCLPGVVFRTTGSSDTNDYRLACWAQKARREARTRQTGYVDIDHFTTLIPEVREMTILRPEEFCERLVAMFADCGVALVFLPHIGGSFLHGASFGDGAHIVMGLTVRGRDADRFWFSLFHEMYHIIYGHIYEICDNHPTWESEADRFAADILIPPDKFRMFLERGCFTKGCIVEFAAAISVDPGIVVGRLQKENMIPFSRHNDLKTKYEVSDEYQ